MEPLCLPCVLAHVVAVAVIIFSSSDKLHPSRPELRVKNIKQIEEDGWAGGQGWNVNEVFGIILINFRAEARAATALAAGGGAKMERAVL